MTVGRAGSIATAAMLVLGACRANVDLSGQFGCADGTCPGGYVCNEADECVAASLSGGDGGGGADAASVGEAGGSADAGSPSGADGPAGTPTTLAFGERAGADVGGVTQDAFLVEWGQALNAGATEDVHFAGGAGDHEVGLLRFDLGSIPANATVTAAELRLYSESGTSLLDVGNQVAIFELLEAWDEGAATLDPGTANWDQRVAGTAWASEGAGAPGSRGSTPLASVAWSTMGQEHTIALPLAVVQRWVEDANANHGLAFATTQTDNADYGYFLSSDNADDGKRPLLVVTFF
jgi:hypothetical protein